VLMEHIYNQHQKWIKIARTFGANDVAEDLVQDAYIKALNRENRINDALFYYMLRDTISDHFRKEKRECLYIAPTQFITEHIYNFIDTWHPYERKLYLTYVNEKLSMRDISEQTGISLTSIFNTIKNCNEVLRKYIIEHHEEQC